MLKKGQGDFRNTIPTKLGQDALSMVRAEMEEEIVHECRWEPMESSVMVYLGSMKCKKH